MIRLAREGDIDAVAEIYSHIHDGEEMGLSIRVQREDIFQAMHRI